MDISETYIKMCQKATEIQKVKIPSDPIGYLFFVTPIRDICPKCVDFLDTPFCPECGSIAQKTEIPPRLELWHFHPNAVAIWLPRQDQLQEMVDIHGDYLADGLFQRIHLFSGWALDNSDAQRTFISMEQLWLAFVMKEKYQKVWNGEEWVK